MSSLLSRKRSIGCDYEFRFLDMLLGILVARGRLAIGTPSSGYRYPPPLAVGFAEFALNQTALGREAAVTR